MMLIKNDNFNLRLAVYYGKFWLLLLMSISLKMTAQIHFSDKTVFTVNENTIIYSSDNISEEVSLWNSKDTKTVKIYVRKGTQITNFPSDSLNEIVYLEEEKLSEKPVKEVIQKEKKTHKPSAKTKGDVGEKELVAIFTSKQNNLPTLLSKGFKNFAISPSSGSFFYKSFLDQLKHKEKNHLFIFQADIKYTIDYSKNVLRKHQHLLQEKITRPPPILDFDSLLGSLI